MSLENNLRAFWKPLDATQDSQFIKNGWSLPERIGIASIRQGGHMHKDLGALAKILMERNNAAKWSVARIECASGDYEQDKKSANGWYIACRDIVSDTGVMPLEEAMKRYIRIDPAGAGNNSGNKKITMEIEGRNYLSLSEAARRTGLDSYHVRKQAVQYGHADPAIDFYQTKPYQPIFVPLDIVAKIPSYRDPAATST